MEMARRQRELDTLHEMINVRIYLYRVAPFTVIMDLPCKRLIDNGIEQESVWATCITVTMHIARQRIRSHMEQQAIGIRQLLHVMATYMTEPYDDRHLLLASNTLDFYWNREEGTYRESLNGEVFMGEFYRFYPSIITPEEMQDDYCAPKELFEKMRPIQVALLRPEQIPWAGEKIVLLGDRIRFLTSECLGALSEKQAQALSQAQLETLVETYFPRMTPIYGAMKRLLMDNPDLKERHRNYIRRRRTISNLPVAGCCL